MMEWSNAFVLKFLEHYQNEPVLCNPMHTLHKDKKRINDAWFRLSENAQRPVSELKKKKESLMATFRGHLRRKKASIRTGAGTDEIYKPIWFAYEFMESFLAPVYECTTTIDTQENIDEPSLADNADEEVNDVVVDEIPVTPTTSKSATATIKTAQTTIRRRSNPPELQEAGNQMKEAFNMLSGVINKRAREREEDECDLYAKMLSKKLRKLPEDERELFMYKIDGMFIDRKHRNSTFATSTSGYTISPSHTASSNDSTSNRFSWNQEAVPSYSEYPATYERDSYHYNFNRDCYVSGNHSSTLPFGEEHGRKSSVNEPFLMDLTRNTHNEENL